MTDMDVSKYTIERGSGSLCKDLDICLEPKLSAALTAERERADKAEAELAEVRVKKARYCRDRDKARNSGKALKAACDDLTRQLAEAEQERDAAVDRAREASKYLAIETNHAEQAERQLTEAVEVVGRLIGLKNTKEYFGHMPEYLAENDAAWDSARAFLQKQEVGQ